MEKKRKGYKTSKAQVEANERYLEKNPEARPNKYRSNDKTATKRFIRDYANIEELKELEILIKKEMEELKMKKIFKEIKGQVNFERDLYVDKDNLDKVTGLCTVDFIDGKFKGMSVAGKVVNNGEYEEITIDDEAIVYNPAE